MNVFEEDIELMAEGESLYRGRVSENWLVNGNPFGGFLLALLANAMMQESARRDTPIVTANFIAKCDVGPADIAVDVIHRSRQFDRLEARLYQDGEECIRALGTFKTEPGECPVRKYESGPPEVMPLEECVRVELTENFTMFEHVDVRLDPRCTGWMLGDPADRSEIKGWMSFTGEGEFDAPRLILAADSFPPAVLVSQGMLAWVPTIEMSVNVRNIPRGAWLKCVFQTNYIDCGLVEEDGEVWDETGSIAAISRQIAQFRKSG